MRNSLLVIGLILLVGCATTKPDYSDIPLSSGSIPYRLPPGLYMDDKGIPHNEENYRWSLSEEDLYENTQNLDNPKIKIGKGKLR